MSNNIDVQPGERKGKQAVATDLISSVHYPIYKVSYGAFGTQTPVDSTNRLPVRQFDFFFDVSAGKVAGHSGINVFGHNEQVGTAEEHLWEYGGGYTYSSTADITQISSDSAGDTNTVLIEGLDVNHAEKSVNIILNGTTPVGFSGFFRILNVINTSSTDFVGNISVITNSGTYTAGVPDTASTVRAYIVPGDNISMMAMYTIPAGKTGYIVFGKASVSSGKDVVVRFYGRTNGGVFMLRHIVDINSANYDYFFKAPMKMPEKTDIEVRATSSGAGTAVSAAFDIILVDN